MMANKASPTRQSVTKASKQTEGIADRQVQGDKEAYNTATKIGRSNIKLTDAQTDC